jgi:hypothetical protein
MTTVFLLFVELLGYNELGWWRLNSKPVKKYPVQPWVHPGPGAPPTRAKIHNPGIIEDLVLNVKVGLF